jgi:hypothetical protein
MELTVRDRLMVSRLLPNEGDARTIKIIRKLNDDLGFNEEEVKEFEIVTSEGGHTITWNAAKDRAIEIPIGEVATEIIVDALKKLDETKKLTGELLPIWDKFMETT